jgi:hypothetical protein
MCELEIIEAGSVRFPMLAHAAAVGWTRIRPEVARQKRGGEATLLLRRRLQGPTCAQSVTMVFADARWIDPTSRPVTITLF